jgi:hypothetical protein
MSPRLRSRTNGHGLRPKPAERSAFRREEPEAVSTDSEGKLQSEAPQIQQQAEQARNPEEGENLIPTLPDREANP